MKESPVLLACPVCQQPFYRRAAEVRYRLGKGKCRRVFCSRACSQESRKTDFRTPEQKKVDKATYDAQYASKNKDRIKARNAAYFKRTYDPAKASIERKAKMPRHVEYCRRPEYRAYKRIYDARRRSSAYGEFSEVYTTLMDLNKAITCRSKKKEIYETNNTLNKSQRRKRANGT